MVEIGDNCCCLPDTQMKLYLTLYFITNKRTNILDFVFLSSGLSFPFSSPATLMRVSLTLL